MKNFTLTDEQYVWLLATLRQHARNMYITLGGQPSNETKEFLAMLNEQCPHELAKMPDMGI